MFKTLCLQSHGIIRKSKYIVNPLQNTTDLLFTIFFIFILIYLALINPNYM